MAEKKEGAIIKTGREGVKLAISLYEEFGLPLGLLPLEEVIEVGFVRETGYMWVRQEKWVEHRFEKIGKTVGYEKEVTSYIEKGRIKKLKGVKGKEFMMWSPCYEIIMGEPSTGKVHFKSIGGFTVSFPAEAFGLGE